MWPTGCSALMLASGTGCSRVVERLLAYKACTEKCDAIGLTALMLVARNGHAKVIQMLLSKGGVGLPAFVQQQVAQKNLKVSEQNTLEGGGRARAQETIFVSLFLPPRSPASQSSYSPPEQPVSFFFLSFSVHASFSFLPSLTFAARPANCCSLFLFFAPSSPVSPLLFLLSFLSRGVFPEMGNVMLIKR